MSDLNKLVFIKLKIALRLPGKDCQKNISELLSLNALNRPQTANLQRILQSYQDNDVLEETVDAQNLPFGNAFKHFIVNYLILVRDFNPWSLLQSIDLMLNYYRNLTRCFENKDLTTILQKTLVDSTEYLIAQVIIVDVKLLELDPQYKKFTRLEYFTEQLLSIFNKIIISKTTINENLISYLAIKIMNMYFKLDKPRLCNNILTNIRNLGLQFNSISMANKVKYQFLVGKFYFLQENFMRAFNHFEQSLKLLNLAVTPVKNLRIILKYLIPTALIVGRRPDFRYMAQLVQMSEHYNLNSNISDQANSNSNNSIGNNYEVIQLYQLLTTFIKLGDLNSVNAYLYQYESSLQSARVLIPLIQRTRVITLRNLIYKIYRFSGNFQKNTLSFTAIKLGLRLSIGQENFPKAYLILLPSQHQQQDPISDLLTENFLINLIDQTLIKLNIFSRLKLIRFSKTNSFPNVYEVYSIKFQ